MREKEQKRDFQIQFGECKGLARKTKRLAWKSIWPAKGSERPSRGLEGHLRGLEGLTEGFRGPKGHPVGWLESIEYEVDGKNEKKYGLPIPIPPPSHNLFSFSEKKRTFNRRTNRRTDIL